MEEFSALAARVAASVVELRGCLILSRDGLVLGAFPAGEEGLVKSAWLRFAVVGEPEKGFIEFGDEIWTYVRRGQYAAFAVSGLGVRPGLLIDQMDQMLYTAEEVRARREALRIPEASPAPSEQPRGYLDRETHPSASTPTLSPTPTRGLAPGPAGPPPVLTEPPPPRPISPEPPLTPEPPQPASSEPPQPEPTPEPSAEGPSAEPPSTAEPAPAEGPSSEPVEEDKKTEVDRVALAQELSKLLQETADDDENQ
jgi:hypothetical protein